MAEIEKSASVAVNRLKWVVVGVLVLAAIVGNLYFGHVAAPVRVAGIIVVAAIALWLAKTTVQGGVAWGFIKEARMEMRKVVWPTRQETLQTAGLVIAVVAIMSLILWGVDSVFALIISNIIL